MRITVTNLYRDRTQTLESQDPEALEGQLVQLFPELCAEVDPDEGLPALLEHLNHSLQGYELTLEPFEGLTKNNPPPAFPKLGMGDNRRETPYVTDKKQLYNKLQLMSASSANHPQNADVPKSYMLPRLKTHASKEYSSMVQGQSGTRGAASSASTGTQTGYVRSKDVAPGGWMSSDNEQLGTKQHEDFHMNMNRMEAKHGLPGRQMLASNLYHAIPVQYRGALDRFQADRAGSAYDGSPIQHEEKLAALLNYMNSRHDRQRFHDGLNQAEDPNYDRQEHDRHMRRAYQAMRAAAETADESWTNSHRSWALGKAEQLEKVSLTPEATAQRMHPHEPQHSLDYERVETYPAGDGRFQHVFYQRPDSSGYQSVMHTLSTSDNPLHGFQASSASGLHPANQIDWPANSFLNNPWQDSQPVVVHGETASRGPKGTGTLMYQNMAKIHGRMASDTGTSVGANGVWEKLAKDPQFKSGLGYPQGHRHWAEYAGPKPTPIRVIHGDGRRFETIVKEPENPYSAAITHFKLKNGGDYLESRVNHKAAGDVGVLGLHLDHANKRLYGTGPYWANKGVASANHFQHNHSWDASGVARMAAEKAIGYKYAGDLPTEIAEQHVRKTEPDSPLPIPPHQDMESDPAYVYHGTNLDNARGIASQGLKVHRPGDFTDQSVWPDGATEQRNYHSATVRGVTPFLPEDPGGGYVVLRTPRTAHPFKQESTGDIYSKQPVPAQHIQIMTNQGWHPVQTLLQPKLGKFEKADFESGTGGNLDGTSEVVADMLGFAPHAHSAFAAARFLTGGEVPSLDAMRRALYEHDGDLEAAALSIYGLSDDANNRVSLRNIQKLRSLGKSESPQLGQAQGLVPEAEAAAKQVNESSQNQKIEAVKLGGRHSAGSLLAQGPEETLLLKPGSNGQSPAAGAQQEQASQSRREACFWHVAQAWGLGDTIPRADLIGADGREYAAIRMLSPEWKNALKVEAKDPNAVAKALSHYRHHGVLHQWAILDAVLGNPDRHAQNLMIGPNDQIQLIDHGSAFAGTAFDPAHDRDSFVPFYLRAGVPAGKFMKMSVAEKLKNMPSLPPEAERRLRAWFEALDPMRLQGLLQEYGINPGPTMARFQRLRAETGPLDLAVNRYWVTT